MPNPRERAQERLEAARGRGEEQDVRRLEGQLAGPLLTAALWIVDTTQPDAAEVVAILRGARQRVVGVRSIDRRSTHAVTLAGGDTRPVRAYRCQVVGAQSERVDTIAAVVARLTADGVDVRGLRRGR